MRPYGAVIHSSVFYIVKYNHLRMLGNCCLSSSFMTTPCFPRASITYEPKHYANKFVCDGERATVYLGIRYGVIRFYYWAIWHGTILSDTFRYSKVYNRVLSCMNFEIVGLDCCSTNTNQHTNPYYPYRESYREHGQHPPQLKTCLATTSKLHHSNLDCIYLNVHQINDIKDPNAKDERSHSFFLSFRTTAEDSGVSREGPDRA